MKAPARLSVSDAEGRRSVQVDKPVFIIGRRTSADLQVVSRDVSREHARITREADQYLIADCGSRFGTFVNGEAVVGPRVLLHGDRIRLGQTDVVDLVFLRDDETASGLRDAGSNITSLKQMTAILNGLRALGSGRVLDEVLTLVLDGALEVTTADRGFIMLASSDDELQFRIGRARGGRALEGSSFTTSQKIPREVFETGQSRVVSDLLEGDLAAAHGGTIATGIRHVLCVPLCVATIAAAPESRVRTGRSACCTWTAATAASRVRPRSSRRSRPSRRRPRSPSKARGSTPNRPSGRRPNASGAWPPIYSARCCPRRSGAARPVDLAATSAPCRTIGGDFFDYLDLPDGAFGFTLGDVAGKGPPAALLAAAVQSNFSAHAPVAQDPADLMTRLNLALLRRAVDARFATMFFGAITAGRRGAVLECRPGTARGRSGRRCRRSPRDRRARAGSAQQRDLRLRQHRRSSQATS